MEIGRIPNRLKKYRRLAGFSQTEVAQFLEFQNSSCVSKWEKGLALPGIIQLFKLCLLYKTVPNHLYTELWQTIKQEVNAIETLLAHNESFTRDKNYFL